MKFDLKLILIVVILSLANGTTVSKLSRTGKNTYCLMNGQLSFDGQFCWYIENTTMDFRNAEKSCINNYGGHLASIHSVFDNMMITGSFDLRIFNDCFRYGSRNSCFIWQYVFNWIKSYK